jgi:hypothetical protein
MSRNITVSDLKKDHMQVANAYRVTVGEFVTECRHPTGVYDWIHLAAPTATA